VMEVLAPSLDIDPRSAYTAGLLRSTGKIAIDRLAPGPAYARNYGTIGKGRPIDEWELELVGIDNCAAAAIVLDEWKFPTTTSGAIRDHYRPGSTASPAACLLNISSGVAERAGYSLPGEQGYWELTPAKLSVTNIDEEQIERAMMIATERFEPARQAIG
jgi:HD-like signal output (HDOD) protein